MDNVYKSNPADLKIIEDVSEYSLTDDVIDEIQLRIIARLEEDLKAELRT